MSGIDPTQRLIAQIRAALSTRPERPRGTAAGPSGSAAARNKDAIQRISQDLRGAIRAVDLENEDGPRRGRRAFIEVVLLDEFGVSLANDPRFPQIVDKVEAVIVGEEELRLELDSLLQQIVAT
ncbi:hypothetical protein D0B54_05000 [Solimonas sp. K1W22B-7]|uniref:hypothetical protein n=1 Tax=Solimonas sp. K1W22B-7 TaxID=2303331 RepID=UPI000E334A03|nr:hypothetical protein [Solimonas sp. K1W22B-7]AXQ28071.1 hypothetical protein D0B54_05000 [Solimonas sp. K1W22B-7]